MGSHHPISASHRGGFRLYALRFANVFQDGDSLLRCAKGPGETTRPARAAIVDDYNDEDEFEEASAAAIGGYRSDGGGRGRSGKGKQPFARRRFPTGKGKGRPAPTVPQAELAQNYDDEEFAEESEHQGQVLSIEYDSIVISSNTPNAKEGASSDSD